MTTITFRRPGSQTRSRIDFRPMLRKVGAKLRRAFELAGNAYAGGAMPPP